MASPKFKNSSNVAADGVGLRLSAINTQTTPIRLALDTKSEDSFEALKNLMAVYARPIQREIETYLYTRPKPWIVAAGVEDAAWDLAQEFIEKRILAPATQGQNIFSEALEQNTRPTGWTEPMRFRDKLIVALHQFVEKEALKPLRRPGLAGNSDNIDIHDIDVHADYSENQAWLSSENAFELSAPSSCPGAAFALRLKLDLASEATATLRAAEQRRLAAVEQALTESPQTVDIIGLARQAQWRPQDLRHAVEKAQAHGLHWDQPTVREHFRADWMQRWDRILQCAAKASTKQQNSVAKELSLSPAQMAQEVHRLNSAYRKTVLKLGRQRGLSTEELEEVAPLRPPSLEGDD